MSQVVIENPIINSPFDEPTRHFRFSDEGITDETTDGRRTSSYIRPHRKAKEEGVQTTSVRHGVDTRPHRREQACQRHPPPRCTVAQGRLRWRDADYRTFDCLLDRSQPRERNYSSVRTKPLKPPSTLPRWHYQSADAWLANVLLPNDTSDNYYRVRRSTL